MADVFDAAFQRFVGLVQPIKEVKHVFGFDQEQDIFTYVETRNQEVSKRLFRAEDTIFAEFPGTLIDFHVVYLEGRPLRKWSVLFLLCSLHVESMPTVEQHREQAAYNAITAEIFAGQGIYDWAVTALFYAALHLVQGHLSRSGVVLG